MNKFSSLWLALPRFRQDRVTGAVGLGLSALLLLFTTAGGYADQVEMQNGDRYQGTVLSLNADVLVLQNDVLGTVKLPRGKVAHITMGPATPGDTASSPSQTNESPRVRLADGSNAPALSLPQLKTNVSSIQQVREQLLDGASPEALAKFNELASGLLTGKLSVADIRAQAKSAADQLRALKADLGEDTGLAVDGYLAILDRFLADGKTTVNSATNTPAKPPKTKSEPVQKEE